MRTFWLFQSSPAGLDKKKKRLFWAWNTGLVFCASVCLGGLSLLFAYGSYSPAIFYSYFTHPWILFLNLAPVTALTALCYLLTGRAAAGFFLSGVVTVGFSVGNYFKLLFRDDPLMFQDLVNIREALSITNTASYDLTPDKRILFGIFCVAFGTFVLRVFAKALLPRKPRFAAALAVVLLCLPMSRLYLSADIYGDKTANYDHINRWAATQVYLSKGFVYPFLHSVTDLAGKAPDGYEEDRAAGYLAQYADADIPAEKKVDLITLQLEAFADFSRFENVEGIDFEKAYSTFHALEAQSIAGTLVTNIFAGGTVDTERAFLTGFAHQQNYRSNTNSYAWYLRDQGYTAEGSHPSYQWFYNRRNINGYLGLPEYYYFENHYQAIEPNYLATDDLLLPEILRLYRENRGDAPYFSFNVTYQGHGPYSTTENEWGQTFTDGRYSTQTTCIVDNYLASLKDTAEELEKFLAELEGEERSVVVVVYGDHMPWLGDGNSAYTELGVDLDFSREQGFYNYYSTRYLIWANSAAKAAIGHDFVGEGDMVSSCFLMNEVFEALGWEGSAWTQAADDLRETLPVLTSLGRYVENGALTEDLSPQGQAALEKYRWMEYYLSETFLY